MSVSQPGGVTSGQVLGNGTRRVVVTATRAQLNAMLRASEGLTWQGSAADPAITSIGLELRSLSNGALLEQDKTTFRTNAT